MANFINGQGNRESMLRHWGEPSGRDGVGLSYSGDSAVISPKGDVLVACEPFADEVKQVDIDLKALREFRVKFPVLEDRDEFTIED